MESNSPLEGADMSKGFIEIEINPDDPVQRACGGKYCHFYEFATAHELQSGIHSWCQLPGALDGTGGKTALCVRGPNQDWHNYRYTSNDGTTYVGSERTPACLKHQPPTK